jgi:hypothetical protein
MARGFDSKSVTDQQDEAERQRDRDPREKVTVSPKVRSLQLARVDLARRLHDAPESRRAQLQAALDALDELIAKETTGSR